MSWCQPCNREVDNKEAHDALMHGSAITPFPGQPVTPQLMQHPKAANPIVVAHVLDMDGTLADTIATMVAQKVANMLEEMAKVSGTLNRKQRRAEKKAGVDVDETAD